MRRVSVLFSLLTLLEVISACAQAEPTATPVPTPAPTTTAEPTYTPTPTPSPIPSPTPEPSPTPLPAPFILEQMAAAYEGIESAQISAVMTMTIETSGLSIQVPINLEMQYVAPDRNQVHMAASFMGEKFETDMISIGDDSYTRETPGMEWVYEQNDPTDQTFSQDDFLVFDVELFEDLTMLGQEALDSTETYHLQGRIPWEELDPFELLFASLMPATGEDATFEVNYWIVTEDFLLRQATFKGTATGEEDGVETSVGLDFSLQYSGYNTPMAIEAPPMEEINTGPGGAEISLEELSPDSYGQIAFISDREGSLDIFLMNVDGSGLVQLTSASADDTNPVWSPDGQRLSFSSEREGTSSIYLMNRDGSEQTRVTSPDLENYWSSWSPDGQQIIYDAVAVTEEDFAATIYKLDLQTLAESPLTAGETKDFWPVWAPDGETIAFTSNRDGQSEIYIMNADGSDQQNLTQTAELGWNNWLPAWSPDGSLIAFSRRREGGDADIYVMNTDGSGLKQLTDNGADDFIPSWSPDGKFIAFVSNRDGDYEIYIMRADGSGLRQLTNHPGADSLPAWRP